MGPSDVVHGWMPLFHIAGQLHMTMTAAVAGAAVGLVPRFLGVAVLDRGAAVLCDRHSGLPAIARILWEQPVTEEERAATEHLRLGIFGPMTPELHRPVEKRLGIRIIDTYGMTEAEPLTVPIPGQRQPVGSCGVAAPDFEVRIADDGGAPVPPGARGEILARPKCNDVIFLGYEGDAKATRETWLDGWFRTRDIGYRDDDGWIFYVDRKAHFIRRRGENVSAWELQRLIEEHPDVAEAFVLGVPSHLGEEEVKAVVVPSGGAQLDPGRLHAWCVDRMARVHGPPVHRGPGRDAPHLGGEGGQGRARGDGGGGLGGGGGWVRAGGAR